MFESVEHSESIADWIFIELVVGLTLNCEIRGQTWTPYVYKKQLQPVRRKLNLCRGLKRYKCYTITGRVEQLKVEWSTIE